MRSTPPRASAIADIPAFLLYGEPLKPVHEPLIHLETIAARSVLHDWVIRPHRHHDLTQVLIVQRGKVNALIDEQKLTLSAPALIILPAGSVHGFGFQPGTEGFVVSFATTLLSDLGHSALGLAKAFETPAACVLNRAALRSTDLLSLATMLLREFTRSAPGRHAALHGLLSALLANVLRLTRQDSPEQTGLKAEYALVARFRHLVEERYRAHLSIDEYATLLNLSETRLRRACLTVTGQSPGELVQLRLQLEAERQLRYTTLSIAQVAYLLGFEDPAYFTRFFTRRARCSPKQFRTRLDTASPDRS